MFNLKLFDVIGIVFFITGFYIDDWLINVSKPQILNLTIVIFLLNLLTATQDIVVDGWALTMLKKFVLLVFFN